NAIKVQFTPIVPKNYFERVRVGIDELTDLFTLPDVPLGGTPPSPQLRARIVGLANFFATHRMTVDALRNAFIASAVERANDDELDMEFEPSTDRARL